MKEIEPREFAGLKKAIDAVEFPFGVFTVFVGADRTVATWQRNVDKPLVWARALMVPTRQAYSIDTGFGPVEVTVGARVRHDVTTFIGLLNTSNVGYLLTNPLRRTIEAIGERIEGFTHRPTRPTAVTHRVVAQPPMAAMMEMPTPMPTQQIEFNWVPTTITGGTATV